MIQGFTDRDFFTVFRNELFSLAPKIIFVWIVVEKLMSSLLFNKKFSRFIGIYILLIAIFAVWLRLIDNYIIIRYFLTHWTIEPLLSIAPFLYNVIKLQFLVTIPFCVKLYLHLTIDNIESKQPTVPAGEKGFLFIKCERRMVKLYFDDICYFEAQGNYLTAVTINGALKTYLSISELEDKLPGTIFTRVHRSFIVALGKVESHTSSILVISNKKIPIGRSYFPKTRDCLLAYQLPLTRK
jgi:DNA-binding LytR/AlgR family response regulator